jgi:glycosyl-4,4'-diaponeurosporenoate acyltransferase
VDRDLLLVLLNSAVWAGWSVTVGWAAQRIPPERLEHDGWLTRLRSWERGGRAYERVGVKRWKDRLPEAGTVFAGGLSKRHLPGRESDDLRRFAAETRRAELVHWGIAALTPAFALWTPQPLLTAMVAYGVLANVPCVVVQRYNRGRVGRVLERRQVRSA